MPANEDELSIHEMEEAKRRRARHGAATADASTAPSGRIVPTVDTAPQEFFSRRGDFDAESLQLKRMLRVLRKHWLLISLVTVLFATLMYAYDTKLYDLLSRPGLPPWVPHLGARQNFALDVTFEHVPSAATYGRRSLPTLELDMQAVTRVPQREAFREVFGDALERSASQDREAADAVAAYLEPGGHGLASLSISLPSQNVGVFHLKGSHPKLLAALAPSTVPALNRYVKEMRLKRVDDAIAESESMITENEKALNVSWRELDRLRAEIDRLDTGADKESFELDRLRKERYERKLETQRLQIRLSHFQERIDYAELAERFHVRTTKDIAKVLIKDNPLREEWAALQTELDRLRTRYRPKHPTMEALEGKIEVIQEQLATSGGTTSAGRVPPIPTQKELTQFQTTAELTNEIELKEMELAELTRQIGRLQAAEQERSDAGDTERMQELLRTRNKARAEIEYLQAQAIKAVNRKAELELERNRITKRQEFETIKLPTAARQISPNLWIDLIMAVIAGFILACGLALFHESMDNTIHTPSDVYYHLRLNYLGVIPFWSNPKERMLDPDRPTSTAGEVYSHLCNNICFGRAGEPERRLLVASTVPGEGKTTISVNLALRYALEGNSVLLIDTDMRRPRGGKLIEPYAGEDKIAQGLSEYLAGDLTYEDAVMSTNIPGLSFLSSGHRPKNPARLLRAPALAALLERAEKEFDVVLLDSAAVLPVVDATILAPHMRGVLLVVGADEVEVGSVRMALYRLQHVGAPVIGAVLSKVRERAASYAYYGYRYSRGYDQNDYGLYGGPQDDTAVPT